MKKLFIMALSLAVASPSFAQSASSTFLPAKATDRTVFFSTTAEGKKLPILWGLDTAWPDEGNMIRGVRFIGAENIGVARVSFQPWDYMLNSTTLTDRLEANLKERLRLVSYIGGPDKVQLVLNNDAPGDMYDRRYAEPSVNPDACTAYCNLIYGTMLSCQEKGWTVVTASPLNEPDYVWNEQGSKYDFYEIAKKLKTEYPQFKDGQIRISGGNTLNCDQALSWYKHLYKYIDEGNTHQLAGDFDHYADFFKKVRDDGKYATADELHNVMEAMVGVEYGMQTGIWWGTAELARGEFCKASFGDRLAYAENRPAWTSAAVYRAPDGKVQAFVGSSERQATPCSYRFVSQDRDVFYNGYGPQREYVVEMPGGNGYQDGQTNAECVVDITWGEDVSPVIDGKYMIINKSTGKILGIKGAPANAVAVKQYSSSTASVKAWEVRPTPTTIGGDFSYFTIKAADQNNFKLDVNNWSLNEGGNIIIYDGGLGGNEQWYLKYVGDGYFRIFSRHSNLCLQLAQSTSSDGVDIVQAFPSDEPSQLWRFIPTDAMCEFVAPESPTDLAATDQNASVALSWTASASSDVASYTVVRALAGTTEYNTVGRGITGTSFVDNTVVPGQEYVYKVKAVDRSCNSSDFTAEVSGKATAAKSLVARLLFNRNLNDETVNGFNAAVMSGVNPVYDVGRESTVAALRLWLNRFVQLPYQAVNYPALTVSTWMSWQDDMGPQTIFDFGSDTDHYVALKINKPGYLYLEMKSDDNVQTLEACELVSLDWQHLAVTIADERVAIFINGKLIAEAPAGMGMNVASVNPVINYIGCDQTRENSFLNAVLQDFSIYNYAIDDAAIPSLMQGVVGICDIADDVKEVVDIEYYNMLGMRVNRPSAGVYLVRRVYQDGTSKTTKENY